MTNIINMDAYRLKHDIKPRPLTEEEAMSLMIGIPPELSILLYQSIKKKNEECMKDD